MTGQSILLRRLNKVVLPNRKGKTSVSTIATFNGNLQGLGYTLSPPLIASLKKVATTNSFFTSILDELKTLRGVQNYKPMYPNFPEQVMQASDAELYLNALVHYFSFAVADAIGDSSFVWLPKYKKEAREHLSEKVQLTVLNEGIEAELFTVASQIATSNTSISATDKEDLKWLISNSYLSVMDGEVKQKENRAYISGVLFGAGLPILETKTATDVLRFATALSGGDVSLAADSKFKNFSRVERRTILQLLNELHEPQADMLRWKMRWIRLGEKLHPFEYKKQYPHAASVFDEIRNSAREIVTFNSAVEEAITDDRQLDAALMLKSRPGEFARRLDHLLRSQSSNSKQKKIAEEFAQVVELVSTPVLLQVMKHFEARDNSKRIVFPKGNLAKVQVIEPVPGDISSGAFLSVVNAAHKALLDRFCELSSLGKVYLDPKLANYPVPFSQRSASASLRTLVRGSKVDFADDKDTIRFFVWWKNMPKGQVESSLGWSHDGRVDLDLSAVLYGDKWKHLEDIAYYNLRSDNGYDYGRQHKFAAVHSGDITNAPKGACEFIDINIPEAIASGVRYVVMSVNGFTGQPFNEIPECSAGWMLRQKPQSGEVFEPKTVVDRVNLTAETTAGTPLIIDLVARKVIWADLATNNRSVYNNVASNRDKITLIAEAFTKMNKPNLYDLLSLHAKARGKLVKKPESADVVYSTEMGFEATKIASEFLQ